MPGENTTSAANTSLITDDTSDETTVVVNAEGDVVETLPA